MSDLDKLSTTPNEPERPPDLITRARGAARAPRAGDKTVLQCNRCPGYVRWGVETLANEATSGSLEPAGTTALEAGLSVLQRFRGVAEIRAARQAALPKGSPETLHWLSDFPYVEVLAAGTDDSGDYRLHMPKELTKRLSNMARHLGMKQTRLGIFALMAGLLQAPQLIQPRYRKAMVQSLQNFARAIQRRAAEVQVRPAVESAADDGDADATKWTLADLADHSEVPHEGQDNQGE